MPLRRLSLLLLSWGVSRPQQKLLGLAAVIFCMYGLQGVAHEYVYLHGGRALASVPTVLELLLAALLSGVERLMRQPADKQASGTAASGAATTAAPVWLYVGIALSICGSRWLTFYALTSMSWPATVVFKSCKLPLVMLAGVVTNGESYAPSRYAAALLMGIAATFMVLAEEASWPSFSPRGVVAVLGSLVCDATLSNLQQLCLDRYSAGDSSLMIIYSNALGAAVLQTATILQHGALLAPEAAATLGGASGGVLLRLLALAGTLGWMGLRAWSTFISKYGAVAATTLGITRKMFFIVVSFVVFSKPFNWRYPVGIACFYCGLAQELRHRRAASAAKRELPDSAEGDVQLAASGSKV